MENPLAVVRKERNLTLADLCILAGLSDTSIQRIQRGMARKVTPELLDVVERLGYSREQFKADYEKWRKYKVEQIQGMVNK